MGWHCDVRGWAEDRAALFHSVGARAPTPFSRYARRPVAYKHYDIVISRSMLASSACVIAGGPRQGLLAAIRLSDLALGRPTRGGMSGEVGLSGGSVALSLRLTERVSSMSTAISEAELR